MRNHGRRAAEAATGDGGAGPRVVGADGSRPRRWSRSSRSSAGAAPPAADAVSQPAPVPRLGPGGVDADGTAAIRHLADRVLERCTTPGRRGTAVLVTTAVPSSGATTVTVNLALEFAARGERVVVIDANPAHPELAARLGVLGTSLGLMEALRGDVPLEAAQYRVPGQRNMVVVPAGAAADEAAAAGYQAVLSDRRTALSVGDVVRWLVGQGNIVLVDGACLLDEDAVAVAAGVGAVLMVEGRWRLPAALEDYVDERLAAVGATVVVRLRNPSATDSSPSGDGRRDVRGPVPTTGSGEGGVSTAEMPGGGDLVDTASPSERIDSDSPARCTPGWDPSPALAGRIGADSLRGTLADDELRRRLRIHLGLEPAVPGDPAAAVPAGRTEPPAPASQIA